MKIDMHCHSREGSFDAKVGIEEQIRILKRKGIDGMLLTDHNSYEGYQFWERMQSGKKDSFVVLKGIEYDTSNGGHFLVILPDGVYHQLLEIRGLSVWKLEHLVHRLGGILGPAHPYDTGFFALMNSRWIKKNRQFIRQFDFIEALNSCTTRTANSRAKRLALRYKKPQTAGSDAHRKSKVGTSYTIFKTEITCNNDLIRAVKEEGNILARGDYRKIPFKKKYVVLRGFGVIAYWIYNKGGMIVNTPARKRAIHFRKKENR